jgi:hypothetical protein
MAPRTCAVCGGHLLAELLHELEAVDDVAQQVHRGLQVAQLHRARGNLLVGLRHLGTHPRCHHLQRAHRQADALHSRLGVGQACSLCDQVALVLQHQLAQGAVQSSHAELKLLRLHLGRGVALAEAAGSKAGGVERVVQEGLEFIGAQQVSRNLRGRRFAALAHIVVACAWRSTSALNLLCTSAGARDRNGGSRDTDDQAIQIARVLPRRPARQA